MTGRKEKSTAQCRDAKRFSYASEPLFSSSPGDESLRPPNRFTADLFDAESVSICLHSVRANLSEIFLGSWRSKAKCFSRDPVCFPEYEARLGVNHMDL